MQLIHILVFTPGKKDVDRSFNHWYASVQEIPWPNCVHRRQKYYNHHHIFPHRLCSSPFCCHHIQGCHVVKLQGTANGLQKRLATMEGKNCVSGQDEKWRFEWWEFWNWGSELKLDGLNWNWDWIETETELKLEETNMYVTPEIGTLVETDQ